MMAHEVPLQARPTNTPATKTNKHKPVPQPKRLPNGEKPDFGGKKAKLPLLPNGEKPNFSPSSDKSLQSPNGDKAGKKTKAKKGGAAKPKPGKKGEESYAGSSFHSSPEALALPKPSFRSSPKTNTQPIESPVQPVHQSPYPVQPFMYQGMPPIPPPQYPVTAYPPGFLPGFNYTTNNQGFINYLYPPSAVPQPPMPMQSYPFQPQPAYPSAPAGQKISFSDLMGSSK